MTGMDQTTTRPDDSHRHRPELVVAADREAVELAMAAQETNYRAMRAFLDERGIDLSVAVETDSDD